MPGMLLASGSEDHTIMLWDMGSLMCIGVLTGHSNWVNALAITPRGDIIASGSGDKTIRLWSIVDHRCLATLTGHTDWVNALTISHDGRHLISGGWDGVMKIWILETHDCMATVRGHTDNISALAMAPGDTHMISGSRDRSIKVWDMQMDQDVSVWYGHTQCSKALAVSRDGKLVVSGSHDTTIKVWDAPSGDCLATLHGHRDYVHDVAFARNDTLLVSASGDATVRVWEFDSRRCLYELKGHTGYVRALAVAPNGAWVVSAGWDETLRMWSLDTGTCMAVLGGLEGKVTAVAITPDASTIVSGSSNCALKLWSAQNRTCLDTLHGHASRINDVAVTADGAHAVSASGDKTIRVWDLESRACVACLEGHTDYVNTLALTTQEGGSAHLISGGHDCTVKLWNLDTRACVASLEGHHAPITDVALSADAQWLYSGSKDRLIRRWPVTALLAPRSFFGLPHFPTYAIEGTINHDRFHLDPARRMLTIRNALRRYPLTLTFTMPKQRLTPLAWAASDSHRLDILRMLFETPSLPLLELGTRPTMLRQAIYIAKDADIVRAVTAKIVEAARSQDEGVGRPELPFTWRLSLVGLDESFTEDVISCIQRYPAVAAEFLDNLGLVRVQTDSGFSQQHTRLPGPQMIVAGNHRPQQHDFWIRLQLSGEFARLQKPSAPGVVTEARVVPLPYAAGFLPGKRNRSLLDALVQAGRAELFSNYIARAVVRFKWETYGRRKFQRGLLWYLISVLLVTTFSFLMNLNGRALPDLLTSSNASDVLSVVVLWLQLMLSCKELAREVQQWHRMPDRWRDFWNWLDAFNVTLTFVVACAYMGGWRHTRALLAVAVYLRWYGLFYFLQAFKRTGPLVRMILVICFDMRFFLMVLGISIIAAWAAFRLLLIPAKAGDVESPLGDPANGLLVMFNMLLLVDFDLDTFVGEYTVLLRVLFLLSMVLVPVVLLNLLIALMSDSYERIQDRADIEFQLLRARILREQEAFFSEERKRDPRIFPKWLHVLVPKGTGVGQGEVSEQWLGVLHVMRTAIDGVSTKVDRCQHEVKRAGSAAQAAARAAEHAASAAGPTAPGYAHAYPGMGGSSGTDHGVGAGAGVHGSHLSMARERSWVSVAQRGSMSSTTASYDQGTGRPLHGAGDASAAAPPAAVVGLSEPMETPTAGGQRRLEQRMDRLEEKLDTQQRQLQELLSHLQRMAP